jgi:uncharacterized protein (TIGR03067 family)
METLVSSPRANEPVLWIGSALGPSEALSGDTVAEEYARFAGTWRFLSVEVEGRRVPAEALRHSQLTLKGNRFLLRADPVTYRGTFILRLAQEPKEIDVHFISGPGAGLVALGIYQLVGDTYTACIGFPGVERPSEFASRPGSGHVLEVLRREK